MQLGTHCRGAIFLDGARLMTPALEAAMDDLSRRAEGFYFGRYDVRVPSVEDLRAGRGLKVLELNGMTSEATHIYDPQGGLVAAYRTLFEQWRLAFAIAAGNRRLTYCTISAASETLWTPDDRAASAPSHLQLPAPRSTQRK